MQLTSLELPIATGIYKITCLTVSKSYIGQAHNIKLRIRQHLSSSINPNAKDYDVPIHAAIRKYGVENFDLEILELCDPAELNSRECYWIKTLRTYIHYQDTVGYNVTEGGKQSVRRLKLTPTILEQIYDLLIENKLSYKEIATKFNLNPGTIQQINSGRLCYNSLYTYPLRDSQLNAHKKKFGNYNYTGTMVEQLDRDTGEVINQFPSAFAAAIALGNSTYNKHIAHCCAGQRKTAYGFRWQFKVISETDWKKLFN